VLLFSEKCEGNYGPRQGYFGHKIGSNVYTDSETVTVVLQCDVFEATEK